MNMHYWGSNAKFPYDDRNDIMNTAARAQFNITIVLIVLYIPTMLCTYLPIFFILYKYD